MKNKDLKYNRELTLFKKTMSSKSVYIEKYVSGIQDRDLLVGQKKKKIHITYSLKMGILHNQVLHSCFQALQSQNFLQFLQIALNARNL